MEEIAFTKVKLPYGWLGNMAPYPIVYQKQVWKTSEALFQALRFADESASETSERRAKIRAEIMLLGSPMAAKMAAKKNLSLMTITPRSPEDVNNMRRVLCIKLNQHIELVKRLLDTKDANIVEDCTARQNESGLFWGAAKVDGKWTGQNMLGKLWMEIRYEMTRELPNGEE